jgi:Fusaric acid resistance protein-like
VNGAMTTSMNFARRRRPAAGAWQRWRGAARARLRGRLLAIVQTAAAAVVAWYLATLLLPDPRPSFAAIAAVVAIGATHGQRAGRAVQLVGGVVLGVALADLIVHFIGSGGWQLGVMVVLAMSAAVLLGGGDLLVVEAGVSAILLVALDPGAAEGFSPNRILEAVVGGGAALAVTSVLFPPDPTLGAGRAAQSVFVELGRTLERVAAGLASRDGGALERALVDSRGIDPLIRAVEDELATGRETARYAPPRRGALVELDRYARSIAQVDYAIRNTRVLARHALRVARADGDVPARLPEALRDLSHAVWELAASYDAPAHADAARDVAVRAAGRVTALHELAPDVAMIAVQARSVAADLVRAADLVAGVAEPADERPTEELLVAPAPA